MTSGIASAARVIPAVMSCRSQPRLYGRIPCSTEAWRLRLECSAACIVTSSPLSLLGAPPATGGFHAACRGGLTGGNVEEVRPQAAASPCDDVGVTDEVLAGQVDYYRRRAGEYDVTAYGDVAAARARIARLVAEMRPTGCVLEIACGTGLWTEELAGWADTVTAIDAAPEAVEIARDRVRSANVSFEVADVFSWAQDTQFDVIFFSAWLSHVPMSRFEQFWQSL